MAKLAPSASSAFTESVWQGCSSERDAPAHLPFSMRTGASLRIRGPDQTGLHIVDGDLQRPGTAAGGLHEIIGNFAAGAASSRRHAAPVGVRRLGCS